MFFTYIFKILSALAPLFIIGIYSTQGTDSEFVLLLLIGISYTILLNIPFINIIAFLVAWIWGLVVVVKNFNALLITFYLCMLFINLLFIFSQQKKKKDALKEINKYTSLNILNKENAHIFKKFKKINNDIIEVDIRNFSDNEISKLRSVLPPKCIHQSDSNTFIAYIYLSECLLSEKIRITNVIYEIETDNKSESNIIDNNESKNVSMQENPHIKVDLKDIYDDCPEYISPQDEALLLEEATRKGITIRQLVEFEYNFTYKLSEYQWFIRQAIINHIKVDPNEKSYVGKIDVSDFNIKEIWEVINLLPLHYIINNPIEDKYLEIYIKDISLDDRAKISSIISNYRTLKAKSE